MAKKSPQPDDTPLSKRLRELAEKANLTRDQFIRMSLLPTDKEQTIMEMVAEGNALIEADEAKKTLQEQLKKHSDAPAQEKTPAETNAYAKAWNQIFEKWKKSPNTAWRAAEIEQMVKGSLPKDRHYDEFIRLVSELGDALGE